MANPTLPEPSPSNRPWLSASFPSFFSSSSTEKKTHEVAMQEIGDLVGTDSPIAKQNFVYEIPEQTLNQLNEKVSNIIQHSLQQENTLLWNQEIEDLADLCFAEIPKQAQTNKNKKILVNHLLSIVERGFIIANSQLTTKEPPAIPSTRLKLSNVSKDFIINSKKICYRVEKDMHSILQHFAPSESVFFSFNIEMQSLSLTEGETHRQGQVPCFIHFGTVLSTKFSIVYKPRDGRIDAWLANSKPFGPYSSLFSLLNYLLGEETFFGVYPFLPKQDESSHYLYVKKIEHTSKSENLSLDEAKKVIRKFGFAEAIFRLMTIEDCHEQNMISIGTTPFFIDLESIFHLPEIKDLQSTRGTGLQSAMTGVDTKRGNVFRLSLSAKQEMAQDQKEEWIRDSVDIFFDAFFEAQDFIRQHSETIETEFVKQLPDDLIIRYVPRATRELKTLVQGSTLEHAQDNMVNYMNGKITWTTKGQDALKEGLRIAYEHNDVPSFEIALKTRTIQCNACTFATLDIDILNQLKMRITQYSFTDRQTLKKELEGNVRSFIQSLFLN